MLGILALRSNASGHGPDEGCFDPFAPQPAGHGPPRTFTPEQIAAAKQDNEAYLAAELQRAWQERLAAELEPGSRLRRLVQEADCPSGVRSYDFKELKLDIEFDIDQWSGDNRRDWY